MCRHSYVCLYWMTHVICFIVERGIARFRCAVRVFNVRASSSPLGYPCAKFRFCHPLPLLASPWRKIAYSLNHSINRSAYLMCREPKLSLRNSFTFHFPSKSHQSCVTASPSLVCQTEVFVCNYRRVCFITSRSQSLSNNLDLLHVFTAYNELNISLI